jgi:hypothetical protein
MSGRKIRSLAKKKPAPVAPLFVDERQRYDLRTASAILHQSRSKTYQDIRRGAMRVIRDGRRIFAPGSELIRLSTLPAGGQS